MPSHLVEYMLCGPVLHGLVGLGSMPFGLCCAGLCHGGLLLCGWELPLRGQLFTRGDTVRGRRCLYVCGGLTWAVAFIWCVWLYASTGTQLAIQGRPMRLCKAWTCGGWLAARQGYKRGESGSSAHSALPRCALSCCRPLQGPRTRLLAVPTPSCNALCWRAASDAPSEGSLTEPAAEEAANRELSEDGQPEVIC